jgi:hypothetical protein
MMVVGIQLYRQMIQMLVIQIQEMMEMLMTIAGIAEII